MKKRITLALTLACGITIAFAQETQLTPLDTLTSSVIKMHSDLEVLKKIKISGYMQPQFQVADSAAISSFAGGNFPANTDKRFALRRARIKVTYETLLSQYVFQIEGTEKGFAVKDIYARFTEPWARTLSLTAGIFNRPFGYEIEYSSSSRETPERGRMSQIIFPGERDLGAMLTIQAPKTSPWNFLRADVALVNGSGSSASDFDSYKDIIGRIRADRTTRSEKIKYGIGVSYYDGGWRQGRKNIYTMGNDVAGLPTYLLNNDTTNYGKMAKRQYMGADFQFIIDWPIGMTTIRAEYIQGQQPGTSSSTASPSVQPTVSNSNLNGVDTYFRNFNGAYFYFIQNIWQTKHQIVVKYDWYDPNTNVAGDDIGKSITGTGFAKTSKQDIKYTTLGIGWTYKWDTNVKLIAYYDMVTNETAKNMSGVTKDLKDNVFTFRMQYKF